MEAPESRLITLRSEFHQAVHQVVGRTRSQLCIQDLDLAEWPLETPAANSALESVLCEPGSLVRIVVHRSDFVEKQAPRLTRLRQRFPGRIVIRVAPGNLPAVEGLLIGDDRDLLRRASPEAWRGRVQFDAPEEVEPWRRKFLALWSVCEMELGLTTLGL